MPMTIHGPNYSTYVRTVRLVLEEKGQAYELAEVDTLKGETKQHPHLGRHPFGMVPAFEHDGFELYETGAIIRYLDRILPEPRLTPTDPKAEARMNQVMGILDAYAYPSIIGSLVIQRIVVPMMGGTPDEQAIAAALPKARTALAEIDRLSAGQPFLAGQELSLADLLVAPVHAYLTATPEAAGLLEPHPGLRAWWERISARPSMAKTAPRLG